MGHIQIKRNSKNCIWSSQRYHKNLLFLLNVILFQIAGWSRRSFTWYSRWNRSYERTTIFWRWWTQNPYQVHWCSFWMLSYFLYWLRRILFIH